MFSIKPIAIALASPRKLNLLEIGNGIWRTVERTLSSLPVEPILLSKFLTVLHHPWL